MVSLPTRDGFLSYEARRPGERGRPAGDYNHGNQPPFLAAVRRLGGL